MGLANKQQNEIIAAQHSASFFANRVKELEQQMERLGGFLIQKDEELVSARLDSFIAEERLGLQN